MNTAEQIANKLESSAAKDARKKIVQIAAVVSDKWTEASSIPAGCGGTPFRIDARNAEDHLHKMVAKHIRKYGEGEMKLLEKECVIGWFYLSR